MNEKEQDKVRVPQQQRSQITRTKIIEAAVQLFAEKGYFHTNSKEIAKAAGVATGSFYSYFPDKLEVYIEAYRLHKEAFLSTIREGLGRLAQEGGDWRGMIRQMANLILEAHHLFDFLEKDVSTVAASDARLKNMFEDHYDEGIALTMEFLVPFEGSARVTINEEVGSIVYFTMHRIIDLIAHKETPLPPEPLIEQLADMLTVYLFGPEAE